MSVVEQGAKRSTTPKEWPVNVKLLTWNLNMNRGSAALGAAVERFAPDIVLLQESARPVSLCGSSYGQLVAGSKWGSWVVARSGTMRRMYIAGYEGWVTGGRLASDDGPHYVFSVHAPGGRPGAPRGSYVKEGRRIVDAIVARVPASATLIIGGDFNFSVGERIDSDPRQTRSDERSAHVAFRAQGFSLAWRDVHPERTLPQTLRWMREPSTPYHCDGFIVRGNGMSLVSCDVHDDASLTAHSDHNPVLLEIRLAGTAKEAPRPRQIASPNASPNCGA